MHSQSEHLRVLPSPTVSGTTVPSLKLYQIQCTPLNSAKEFVLLREPGQPFIFNLIVAAPHSADATRKAIKFFQEFSPDGDVRSIEVFTFQAITDLASTIVVV